MKRIVYIRASNIYNDSRATKEIISLAKNGYKVTVLGWKRIEIKESDAFKDLDVSILLFDCPVPGNSIGIKHLDKLFKFIRWVKKYLHHNKDVIDIIHACDLEGGVSSYKFATHNKIKFIYDIYDYYVDARNLNHFISSAIKKIEDSIINCSDLTIICTEERRMQIADAKPKKIIVIHNSPDIDDIQSEDVIYDYCYCGSLSDDRLIKEILSNYHKHTDLKMFVCGYGPNADLAKCLSDKYDNFVFSNSIPYSSVLETESKSKVLSAIYLNTIKNNRLCAPNKFYESLALGKPLIVCNDTGIDKIVNANHLGLSINYSADEFYDALIKIINDKRELELMGANGKKMYNEKYKWKYMEEILIDSYKNI